MLEFVSHQNNIMNIEEKQFVINLFEELLHRNSFYTNLQLLYNTKQHFSTVPYSVCSFGEIKTLGKIAFSNQFKLKVHGTIHSNHHTSGVLYNLKNEKIFVKDTYISISDYHNNRYHILVKPPKLSIFQNYNYISSENCEDASFFIPPYF